MKQKVANYSIILLFSVAFFGFYQAYKLNKAPFTSRSKEPLKMSKNKINTIHDFEQFKVVQIKD